MTPARLGIIIALLVTTLLGATGALVYRFAQRTNQPPREATFASPTQTPSQSLPSSFGIPQTDGFVVPSDWKIYSNTESGYYIKYPSEWKVKQNFQDGSFGNLEHTFLYRVEEEFNPGIRIFIVPRTTPNDWIDEHYRRGDFERVGYVENITINGLQGIRVSNIPDYIVDKQELVFFDKENKTLIISVQGRANGDAVEHRVFNQILSTFTFTISDPEKLLIDSWIQENNLNQYGDPKDTMYAGGTPLFDERTGERTDRYDYIVQKFPERPWDNQ